MPRYRKGKYCLRCGGEKDDKGYWMCDKCIKELGTLNRMPSWEWDKLQNEEPKAVEKKEQKQKREKRSHKGFYVVRTEKIDKKEYNPDTDAVFTHGTSNYYYRLDSNIEYWHYKTNLADNHKVNYVQSITPSKNKSTRLPYDNRLKIFTSIEDVCDFLRKTVDEITVTTMDSPEPKTMNTYRINYERGIQK